MATVFYQKVGEEKEAQEGDCPCPASRPAASPAVSRSVTDSIHTVWGRRRCPCAVHAIDR